MSGSLETASMAVRTLTRHSSNSATVGSLSSLTTFASLPSGGGGPRRPQPPGGSGGGPAPGGPRPPSEGGPRPGKPPPLGGPPPPLGQLWSLSSPPPGPGFGLPGLLLILLGASDGGGEGPCSELPGSRPGSDPAPLLGQGRPWLPAPLPDVAECPGLTSRQGSLRGSDQGSLDPLPGLAALLAATGDPSVIVLGGAFCAAT